MELSQPGPDSGIKNSHLQHLATISQSICSDNALQIARIFDIQKLRFDISFVTLPGVQTASMASGTLMDGIFQTSESAQRDLSVRHLKALSHALTAMATAYQPVEIMVKAIQNFLEVVVS
jgi:hypothetical protein